MTAPSDPSQTPEHFHIAVMGAGPGGISTAYQLLQRGITDFVVLEKGAGPGGTWYHNRYPGAECDIKSHLYSFAWELKADWSRPYAGDSEIREYLERCVEKYGIDKYARYGTEVRAARWDDAAARWTLTTASGDTLTADIVVSALGMFNELTYPDVEGLQSFTGTMFHTARWDWDHHLDGERVAVIGAAASAIQLVPEVAKVAGQLTLFQRSANWVAPKEDTPYTTEQLTNWAADPASVQAFRDEIFRSTDPFITFQDADRLEAARQACLRAMEVVEDPEVRAKLLPDTPYACHRPLMSNYYYPTFNRANVELVTDTITRVTPTGIVTADGTEREFDTIVCATGFQTTRYLSAIEVAGRNGVRLADEWADGPEAYLGITVSGFPNLFVLYGPNTNNGSIIYMIESQVDYVMRQIERIDREQLAWIDVKRDVQTHYNEQLQRDMEAVGPWQGGCSTYYRGPTGRIVTQWPHTMTEYREMTARPDDQAYATAAR
jgi:cation diffusion facilitator CzcD-associated flavoprotein CzcO